MMKDFRVTLISTEEGPFNTGMRSVSSYLKEHGYDTRLLFLTAGRYSGAVLEEILNFSGGSDLIGISCTSWTANKAVVVLKELKSLKTPVVWGGVHATIDPGFCLKHADIVCRLDGEEAMLKLADRISQGDDITGIENLWVRRGGKVYKSKIACVQDLNSLPFPDYDWDNQYVLEKGKIVRIREKHYRKGIWSHKAYFRRFSSTLPIYTYYGCPHSCSYCTNSVVKGILKSPLRRKSVDYVIREAEHVKKKLPFLSSLWFVDENFFLRTLSEIEHFAEEYRKSIGLPFVALAHPLWLNEEKLRLMVGAGMRVLEMGIESGSERVNREIYNRHVSERYVKDACALINSYRKTLLPDYHVIVRNPYEREDDLLRTIALLRDIPKPFYLSVGNLLFYKGTPLCKAALKDGIISMDNKFYMNAGGLKFGERERHLYNILTMMSGFCNDEYYGITPSSLIDALVKSRDMNYANMIRYASKRIRIYPRGEWQVIEFQKGLCDRGDVIAAAQNLLGSLDVMVEEDGKMVGMCVKPKMPERDISEEVMGIMFMLKGMLDNNAA